MTGGNTKGSSSRKPSHGKSRWESGNNPSSDTKPVAASGESKPAKPSSKPKDDQASGSGPSKPLSDAAAPRPGSGHGPGTMSAHGAGAPFHLNDPVGGPLPDPAAFGPPPPPAYGFHMLDRRTIVLADGSVRSYFALPPDYQEFPPPRFDPAERFLPFGGREREPGGMGLGFDRGFPAGGMLSPDGSRRDRAEMFGRGGAHDYWSSLGLDGKGPVPPEGSQKRKYGDAEERDGRDERDELARKRQQLLHYGNPSSNPNGFPSGPGDHRADYLARTSSPFHQNPMEPGRGMEDFRSLKHTRVGGDYDINSSHGDASVKHHEVDPQALKKSFLHYVKLLYENAAMKKNYLEDGKQGPLQCLTCFRASRDFPDVHGLITHAYNSHDLRVDHLGLHKAICVLMGWNYAKVPDNSKAYQLLSADEAESNKDDLIMWPPMVIIHNTNSGRGKDGRMEGMGNKAMDNKLKDLGISGGKSKSLYGKEGHLGITLVKFAGDSLGLKEALRLADFFEKDNHGRKGWARAQSSLSVREEENNVNLVKLDEKTGEKKRIFYGYLGTASDLEKLDFDTRKKSGIESIREFNR